MIRHRLPLLALGGASLLAGLWGGLVRLGWQLPLPSAAFLSDHGALMVSGFLGTLVSLERAVGLGRTWTYAAPALAGGGALALAAGAPTPLPPGLVLLGSGIYVGASVVLLARARELFSAFLLGGALCWAAGNIEWLRGRPVFTLALWWAGFLFLTIAGERLELSRVLPRSRAWRSLLVVCAVLFVGGALLGPTPTGRAVAGVGFLGTAAWLFLFDVARRNLRHPGLPRYMACCLLSGYLWLGVSGVLLVGKSEPWGPGLVYDAVLHGFFLGFVFSMVFGHAPLILPSVLGVPIAYGPVLYAPLLLLHVSVALRLAADLLPWAELRPWGGLANAAAILLFAASAAGLTVARQRSATLRS